MGVRSERIAIRPRRIVRQVGQRLRANQGWAFFEDVGRLIWEFRLYGLMILAVTIGQEFVALWPVQLLGQFVDRLSTGEPLGNVVLLFLGASLLYPAIVRGNVILRHKMFYESELRKRVELTLQVADEEESKDPEAAGAAHTSLTQAVSALTNAAYHILGSFTPVIIKIIVVAVRLVNYNSILGLAYVSSLIVPLALTLLFNNKLRVLRDNQYSVISRTSGTGIKTILEKENSEVRQRFLATMRERTNILFSLIARNQSFLYIREAALIGSQFLVVFIALGLKDRLGMTPGDFTQVVGYTGQVAVAFLNAVSFVDNIFSHSRAYHVYRQEHKPVVGTVR
jgi:ABC-type multidrug transport system fused ATPase/permease subunit